VAATVRPPRNLHTAIDVTLNAELNGVDQAQTEALVAKAHTICPYSKATRGNIEVKLQANGQPVQA
jgi:lipoyl-dependent peroxiredoxin